MIKKKFKFHDNGLRRELHEKIQSISAETGCAKEELFNLIINIETSDCFTKSNYNSNEFWENLYVEQDNSMNC